MDDFNQAWRSMDLSAPLQGAPPPAPTPAPHAGPTPLTGFDPLSTPAPGGSFTSIGGDAGGPSSDPAAAPAAAPRELLKLDDTRLLQLDALPYLRSVCKNMKFSKAKGDELANLDKLVHFYKVWAHRVFPRYPYDRFVERTMRVCRTKRVKAQMNQWIREELESKGTYDVDPDAELGDEFQEGSAAAAGKDGDHEMHEDRMDVDEPMMAAPMAEPLAPLSPPTTMAAATTSPSGTRSPTVSAKQRALDRLAQLKQSRFRQPMSPASLPSLPPLATGAVASAISSASSIPSPIPASPVPDRGTTVTSTPSMQASSSARRVIVDSDNDSDDDLVIVPSHSYAAVEQDPSASQAASMRVFADMANDDEDDIYGSAFARADDAADAAEKEKEKRATDMGLDASLLEGVDVDALFSLDDEQW